MDTALATPEWQTFTQRCWRVEPVRFEYAPRGPGGPALRAIAYSDRKGRLLLPPYQPHLPLEFTPTPTVKRNLFAPFNETSTTGGTVGSVESKLRSIELFSQAMPP